MLLSPVRKLLQAEGLINALFEGLPWGPRHAASPTLPDHPPANIAVPGAGGVVAGRSASEPVGLWAGSQPAA